jgi:hypothetical protein
VNYRPVDLGVSTADADAVELRFSRGDLHLRLVDWQEQRREIVFRAVLGFQWQEFDDAEVGQELRNDTTYEVVESPWRVRQAELQGERADDYVHYKLCFNEVGVLDVLAKRTD